LHPEPDDIGWNMNLSCLIWSKFLTVVLNVQLGVLTMSRLPKPNCLEGRPLRTFHFSLASWTGWHGLDHGFSLLYLKQVPSCCHRTWTSLEIGRFMSNPEPSCNGEVPDQQFTLNLFLPWEREVHVQLGAFVVCKGSWPTYDIELEPPIEWGGSVPSSNFHRIEKVPDARLTSILDILWNRRIHIRLWTFMSWWGSGTTFDVYTRPPVTSKTSYPTLDLPKNWEVPDARLTSILDLLWYRRIHIRLWIFLNWRGSWPTWNLHIIERFIPTLNLRLST
jgi:hypothetical protein